MIQNKEKKTITIDKSAITDGIIFLVGMAVFSATLFALKNAVITYTNAQKGIDSTLLTSSINDAQIAALKKVNIEPSTFIDALPTQKTIIQWVQQTETMAKLTNIEQSVNFTTGSLTKDGIVISQTAGSNSTIPVNLVLKGKYAAVLSYIQLLNTSYYYTKIDGITFSAIRSGSSSSSTPAAATPTPVAQNPNEYVTATLMMEIYVQDITSQISE